MTVILTNEDNGTTREFDTTEEAEEVKAEFEGMGATLTIESASTDDDDLDVEHIAMPGDQSESNEVTEERDRDACPSCGEIPETIYRCHCGRDLAGEGSVGTGRQK